jgi:hypothetical protein
MLTLVRMILAHLKMIQAQKYLMLEHTYLARKVHLLCYVEGQIVKVVVVALGSKVP